MNALLSSKPETETETVYAARGAELRAARGAGRRAEPTGTGADGARRIPAIPAASVTSAASPTPAAPAAPAAPGPLASFARFVLCGGGIGILFSLAVALLADLMPWTMANAVITIASTILCTELHARFTFGSGQHAGWRQHWQSAGSAAAAYAATSAAILILHTMQPSPGMLTEQIVYLSASALAGIGRFLLLRLFVFAKTAVPTVSTVPGSARRGTTPSRQPYRTLAVAQVY